jgi:3(or 17)beta-hydroxysteroid dehydrogenase
MHKVQDKVCIISGGAMGIGLATSKLFASEGAKVILADIQDEQGRTAAKSLRNGGHDVMYLSLDVTDEAAWKRVFAQAIESFGRVDVLVNNAGIAKSCSPEEQSLDDWRAVLSVNLDGLMLGTKHAIRAMKLNTPVGGSIINMSSVAGLVGAMHLGAYCASKGGVTIYTKSVALYCAQNKLGIRVNSVHPGYIMTPMVEAVIKASSDEAAMRATLDARHPIGHMGEVEDVAHGVLYLASDESKFVTGSSLVIDGGICAQ